MRCLSLYKHTSVGTAHYCFISVSLISHLQERICLITSETHIILLSVQLSLIYQCEYSDYTVFTAINRWINLTAEMGMTLCHVNDR